MLVNPSRDVATALPEVHEHTWDWGSTRGGSWQRNGEETSISRYIFDFQAWEQRNLDNDRRRSVRLVWVATERVDPQWTGQIPQ